MHYFVITECSQPLSTGSKELEEYGEIRDLIEKIRALQTGKNLYLCLRILNSEANIRSDIEDNSEIIFLISQQKHML